MKEYYKLVGAIEALSRIYLALITMDRTKEALIVRTFIDNYILHLGMVADKFRTIKHIREELPGDPLDVKAIMEMFKKKE
ncbi:MAG: hypothetical protein DRO18_01115 [Thermoprotei archaeon]|nr:MAG: hypothetical protein DRO18_01115 [Thermoprotei archaeon]